MAIIGTSGKKQSGKSTVAKIIQDLTWGDNWQVKLFAGKVKDIACLLLNCSREQLESNEFKEKELGEEWRVWYCTENIGAWKGVVKYKRVTDLFDDREKVEWMIEEVRKQTGKRIILNDEVLTPRKILQLIGTEAGRQIIHPNLWVNALMSEYQMEGKVDGEEKTASDGGYYSSPSYRGQYPNWIIADVRFPNEVKAIKDKKGVVIRINRYQKSITDTHLSETALDSYTDFDYTITNNGTISELISQVGIILQDLKIII